MIDQKIKNFDRIK